MQSVAELAYEFIADTIRNTIGEGGMQFFPLVFSLFHVHLVSNIVGLIPYNSLWRAISSSPQRWPSWSSLPLSSTDSWKNGLHFFKMSCRVAFQAYILPFVVMLECFSVLRSPGVT